MFYITVNLGELFGTYNVLQLAIDEGHLTQQQVDGLIEIARNGISATEFRDLPRSALDVSEGNIVDPEKEIILLDFYFRQATKGRVLMHATSIRCRLH